MKPKFIPDIQVKANNLFENVPKQNKLKETLPHELNSTKLEEIKNTNDQNTFINNKKTSENLSHNHFENCTQDPIVTNVEKLEPNEELNLNSLPLKKPAKPKTKAINRELAALLTSNQKHDNYEKSRNASQEPVYPFVKKNHTRGKVKTQHILIKRNTTNFNENDVDEELIKNTKKFPQKLNKKL